VLTVLRDKQRHNDVYNAGEVDGSPIDTVAWTA
jgi:hypothetical protein